MAEPRWPRRTPARALQLVTIALASVWALEAFAYTMLTVLLVAVPSGDPARGSARRAPALGGADRRRRSGRPPPAGRRHVRGQGRAAGLGLVHEHPAPVPVRELGDWTYDFSAFSPGLSLGAPTWPALARSPCVVAGPTSSTATARLLRHHRHDGLGHRPLQLPRQPVADHIIPYVCQPLRSAPCGCPSLDGPGSVSLPRAGRRSRGRCSPSSAARRRAWSSAGPLLAVRARPRGAGRRLPRRCPRPPPGPPPSVPRRSRARSSSRATCPTKTAASSSPATTSRSTSCYVPDEEARSRSATPGGQLRPGAHFEPLGEFVDGLDGGELMLIDAPARRGFDLYRAEPGSTP